MIKIIFAHGTDMSFGNKNRLPWPHNKQDMNNFVEETRDSCLVMGVNTFKSLPKLLQGRTHVVVATHNDESIRTCSGERPDIVMYGQMHNVLSELKTFHEKICVIGGPKLFADSLDYVDEIVKTVIDGSYEHDVSFPESIEISIDDKFELIDELRYSDYKLTVKRYKRK